LTIHKTNPEDYNENVSDVNHVKEVFLLVGSIFLIALTLYWSSILALDSIVDRLTPEREAQIMGMIGASKSFSYSNDNDAKEKNAKLVIAKRILDDLVTYSNLKNRNFTIKVIPGKDVNAFAVPGDTILLVEELLDKVETENELAMVLGHELGHFHFRHHLKGMGRSLVMGFFSMMIFGEDNPLSKLFLGGLDYSDRKYNQKQETDCDLYGAELVFKKYTHLGGGLRFFERLGEKEGLLHKYFSTHPLSQDRLKRIEQYALDKSWPLTGELIPLEHQMDSAVDSL